MALVEVSSEDDFSPRKILFDKLRECGIESDGISDEMQLRNVHGLDSLDFLSINTAIEEEYNIKLDIQDYDERSTLGDWIKYIEKRKRNI